MQNLSCENDFYLHENSKYRNGSAIVPLGPVQTYPDIFESANSSLRIVFGFTLSSSANL